MLCGDETGNVISAVATLPLKWSIAELPGQVTGSQDVNKWDDGDMWDDGDFIEAICSFDYSDISELESGDSSFNTAGKFIFIINLLASFCNVYLCLRFQNNQNSHWWQGMEMSLLTKL